MVGAADIIADNFRRVLAKENRAGVGDFIKQRFGVFGCYFQMLGVDQLRALGPAAMTLARVEGLEAHRRSVGIRLNLEDNDGR